MIQEYNPSIEYTPGKANVIADALSRKAYCNSLILKPFQPDLYEALRKLNLQVVPQGFIANLQVTPTPSVPNYSSQKWMYLELKYI